MFNNIFGKSAVDKIVDAALKNDVKKLVELLKANHDSIGFKGPDADKVANAICASELPLYNWLIEYNRMNPDKLTAAQYAIANFYSRENKPDDAAMEARHHLTKILQNSAEHPSIMAMGLGDHAAFCCLIISSVFSISGARTYAKKLITRGLAMEGASDKTLAFLKNEITNLNNELAEEENQKMDLKWNQFFQCGANSAELISICDALKHPLLARRVDLIEANFRFNKDYVLPENEYLQEVFQVKINESEEVTWVLQ